MSEARGTSSYPCYRQLFWLGVLCTVFFLLLGAGSFVVAYWNIDGSFGKPRAAAFLFAGFWALWAAVGAWMILSAARSRLNLKEDCLEQVGCFRRTTLRWGHISGVRWRLLPAGGSVVLRGVNRRVTIKFGGFASQHRPEIIQYVHRSIAVPVQEDWEVFEQRWLTSPGTGPQGKGSHRALLGAVLFVFGGLFTLVWALGLGIQYLCLAVVSFVAAVWIVRQQT